MRIFDYPSVAVVNGSQSGLIAVDAKTGREIWTLFAAGNIANVPTPAYADGYLLWSVWYSKGAICFKAIQNGNTWNFTEAWISKDLSCHPRNYVVAQGCVYGKGKGGLLSRPVRSSHTRPTPPPFERCARSTRTGCCSGVAIRGRKFWARSQVVATEASQQSRTSGRPNWQRKSNFSD